MSALPDTQSDFSHEIIGAAVEVQRVLGTGLDEAAYAAALGARTSFNSRLTRGSVAARYSA